MAPTNYLPRANVLAEDTLMRGAEEERHVGPQAMFLFLFVQE